MSRVITTGWCPGCCVEVIAIRPDGGTHDICEECHSWVGTPTCTCDPQHLPWLVDPMCPAHGPRERL